MTVLGISVAVGALLVLATFSAVTSAVRSEHQVLLASGDPTCSTGDTPRDPGFDPVTHEIYVPNEGYPGPPSITVFNGTCHLVGTIPLPSGAIPIQAAFDPQDNDMYVTDYGLNQVYRILGTTIENTITGFDEPMGITYSPWSEFGGLSMLVVNSGDDRVSAIYGTENLGAYFYTGSDPYAIAYDPSCVCELVTNTGSDNVTIYLDYSGVTYSQPVGKSPRGVAYDPFSTLDYVANSGSNNVSVLDAAAVLLGVTPFYGTISGFDGPYGVAFDQSTGSIWVTNDGNGKLFEIGGGDGSTILEKLSTASDSHSLGLAYDEFNDDMYATGFDTNVVYVRS